MASPLSLFVNQLSSLGNELSDMYPYDVDIKMAKNTIDMSKSVNPKMLFETFYQFVYPYKDQIMVRDENFFLNMDVSQFTGEGVNLGTVMNLKKYWSGMSPATKDCMWQYFGVLVKLCEKVRS